MAHEVIPFKVKLRKELLRVFQKATIFIGLSYVLVLLSFVLLVQFYQLNDGRQAIKAYVEKMTLQTNQMFRNLEEGALPAYLSGEIPERELFRRIYGEAGKLPFRSALSIYSADKDLLLSTKLPNQEEIIGDSFVKIAMANITGPAEYRISKDDSGNRYLLKIKPVLTDQGEQVAYLVLYIDGSDFDSGLQAGTTQYAIVDKYQNLFSSNKTQAQDWQKLGGSQFQPLFTIRSGKMTLNATSVLDDQLILYSSVSLLPVSYLLFGTVLFVSVLMLVLMGTAVSLSKRIALHSSDSVEVLVSDLRLIMKGYKSKLEINTEDEFGYLAQKINSMIDTSQRLFQQALKSEKEKGIVQRKLLEAQFNPHFLYNSLESIKILIQINPQKAEQMILSLNRVLRYSISSELENVPLEQDMEVLEHYLAVNQIRFDQLDFAIACSEVEAKLLVPKLFLLPLLENALKYGMRVRHDLRLRLTVSRDEDLIRFMVLDNGVEFSADFKQDFANYLKTGSTEHGLINSYSRLSMLYSSSKIELVTEGDLHGVVLTLERKQACYD